MAILCLGLRPFIQTTLFDESLFGFSCAVTGVFVCYCVVPKCVCVIIMCAPFNLSSSSFLCSSAVYRPVYVDLQSQGHTTIDFN
jgi:hypothetical protein